MPSHFSVGNLSDARRAVRRSARLMRRVHSQLLPRARRLLNSSDELLDRGTAQELASAQRLADTRVGVPRAADPSRPVSASLPSPSPAQPCTPPAIVAST